MKPFLLLFSLVPTVMFSQLTPSIDVTGEGIVYVTPDIIEISLNIENEGSDIKEVKQKNGESIAKVIDILTKELPAKSFQTEFVSLRKEYDYDTKEYKFRAKQTLNIKLEDVKKYESLMESVFEAGVNRINSVTFDVKNRELLLREAREMAVNNAREKALFYAVSLEQNIGKALKVSEDTSTNFYNDTKFYAKAGKANLSSEEPTLALGTIAIEAKIHITFELLKE